MISIIIPTSGRISRLEKTLMTLRLQDEQDFEVHVIADCDKESMTLSVRDLVRSFADHLNIYWHDNTLKKPFNAASARNIGIRAAKGDKLLFVDDDCLCPPDVVSSHMFFPLPNRIVIGFRRHVPEVIHAVVDDHDLFSLGHPGNVMALHYMPDFRLRNHKVKDLQKLVRHESGEAHAWAFTCHMSVTTATAKMVGGFWEQMPGSGHEDKEFALRCWRAGAKFAILDEPQVYHQDHPQCQRQIDSFADNKTLLEMTRKEKVMVRNGGPIP